MRTKVKVNAPCWCGSGRKYKKCHQAEDFKLDRERSLGRADREATRVLPGVVTPMREVPSHIPRPPYAETGIPPREKPPLIKSAEEIERMRRAGKVASEVRNTVAEAIAPGVTTEELDILAHETYIKLGAFPSTLNYHGFPKTMCTSVNEVVVHGIPDSRPLEDGDIVSCDFTAYIGGVHGDTCATYPVGTIDDHSQRLIDVTRECLERAIGVVRDGAKLNDIGRAIQPHAEQAGYGVVRNFVGHGIGSVFHMDPQVPHYFDPKATLELKAGMTFTIEPMITAGSHESDMWDDGWTAVTTDLLRAAQFEHTILVTDTGAEVLTA